MLRWLFHVLILLNQTAGANGGRDSRAMEALRLLTLRKNADAVEPSRIPKETLADLPQIALVSCLRKFIAYKTKAKNFEDSAIASMAVLGIDLVELPRWNCCGASYCLAEDDLIHQVAPVRDLIWVKTRSREPI